jgi:hypothetical protein
MGPISKVALTLRDCLKKKIISTIGYWHTYLAVVSKFS